VFLVLKPFINYIFFSIILAFTSKPLYTELVKNIGEKTSAFITVLTTILLVFIPMLFVGATIADDAGNVISMLSDPDFININQTEAILENIVGQHINLREILSQAITNFSPISTLGNLANSLGSLSIGLTTMFFLQFYLLKDGDALIDWARSSIPLPDSIKDNLIIKVKIMLWVVIKGQVLVAVIQGIVGGIGLHIAGISNVFFWTFTMIILSLVPMIGSFGIWGPASLYLVLSNNFVCGVFLFLYGSILVNLTDNFFRPLLVDKSAELHPALILLGAIGGFYLLGVVGVFYGPILFGVLKSIFTVFKSHFDELK